MHWCVRRLAATAVRVDARLSHTRLFTYTGKQHLKDHQSCRGFSQNVRVQSNKTEAHDQDTHPEGETKQTPAEPDSSAALALKDAEVLDDLQNLLRQESQEGSDSNLPVDEPLEKDKPSMTDGKPQPRNPSPSVTIRRTFLRGDGSQSSMRRYRRTDGDQGTVVVTGGSGAIGRAIGVEFASQGYSVVLCGRDTAALTRGMVDLNAASQSPRSGNARRGQAFWHDTITGDVCEEEFYQKLVDMGKARLTSALDVISKGGEDQDADVATFRRYMPSILVNCAGISQSSLLANSGTTHQKMSDILDTNLLSAIKFSKWFVLQKMVWNRHYQRFMSDVPLRSSVIINVSSLLATHGGAGASVYAASKAGMIGKYYFPSAGRTSHIPMKVLRPQLTPNPIL